jgi:hypothetical protein
MEMVTMPAAVAPDSVTLGPPAKTSVPAAAAGMRRGVMDRRREGEARERVRVARRDGVRRGGVRRLAGEVHGHDELRRAAGARHHVAVGEALQAPRAYALRVDVLDPPRRDGAVRISWSFYW